MQLEIVTPEKIIYQGDVDELYINTSGGEIGILPHHVNLFTQIEPGELRLKISEKEQFMAVTGGFLEVSNNKITILADYAVHAEEIEVEKAMEARKRAEEILKKKESQITEQEFAAAEAAFKQAIAELKVVNRRRNRPVQ
ncbi:MAG TPA: ATP synthase F1 subunit epsilon [Candidatus Sulfotelmatobacter sp.]|jgi:F-type H+-transporting ATPase subunit epsilon|nr:ATP synthase F1 subunit epsilon [Candidatus Sulfotelmatobacter sp.]